MAVVQPKKTAVTPPKAVVAARATIKPPNGAAGAVVVGKAITPKLAAATPANDVELKETVLQVQRRYGDDTTEALEVRAFATRTASVSVSAKQRIGSISQGGEVSVMVTVPCYAEEIDEAKAYASEKVGEYLAVEQERLAELAGPDAAAQRADVLPGEDAEEPEVTAEGETETAEEGGADAPYIRAIEDEESFMAFCQEAEVEIDMDQFEHDLDQAKEAVITHLKTEGQIPLEEGDDGYVAPEAEEATEDGSLYTEEELNALTMDQLAAIFAPEDEGGWGINNGKLPAKAKGASPKDHKLRCIKAILEYQAKNLSA